MFHLAHGVLGYSDFPTPFAAIVGSELFTNVANVIWGLFNFAVAAFVILSCRRAVLKRVFAACHAIGFLIVAFLLRYVLLAGYFQTHSL